ncbi:MAG: sulfatase-like hydrolase/transferase [Phycisphaerales bacterium]|nr:sulfatase-like hydrolase/transferase [Phycisphaerales bacterium]
MDAQVGRLLSTLEELKLDRNTLVVVIGDHGEGKGQHGENTHGPFVYDATMSAPLLVRRPDGVGAGRRISAQVRSVDVAPTILSWAKLLPLPGAAGVDLAPLMTGAKGDLGLAAYGESFHSRFSYGYSQLRMLREGHWKYIHAPVKELYDIAADPGETRNLAEAEPQRVAQMRLQMQKWIGAAPPSAGALAARQGISEQTARNLQALGYPTSETVSVGHENASELDLFVPSGPNPADHALDIQLMSQAAALLARGQAAEAERPLREILQNATAANPGPFRAYVLLGRVLDKLRRLEEAVEAFRAALHQNAEDAATLTDLGNALAELKRYDDAVAAYQAATQIRPPLARAFLNLAMVLSSQGKWEDALPAAQQAVKLDSGSAKAHSRHGLILLKLNRPAEAYQAIQRAANLDPKNEEYQRALKDLGAALGRG